MSTPNPTLEAVLRAVRRDDTLLSERLREPAEDAPLGALAAAGPRAAGAEQDYAFVVEAIREGYLLHYGEPRLFEALDEDLALLAGDHLYALGLECLAGMGDLEAVRELADLISLCAVAHADGAAPAGLPQALWLACVTAVGSGSSPGLAGAKDAVRGGRSDSVAALVSAAQSAAGEGGVSTHLAEAANSIDFELQDPRPRG